eukprot:TRINITY_DN2389_c0_g1_i26.p1 TRINITY_DN2389_c0_g1~~TRINITY_DN2389_c0_g1_i26.p1  ORF type:complete len:222 (-),score=43.36 TRINITY_DN2389_c0_g1_i26:1176-1841(-)
MQCGQAEYLVTDCGCLPSTMQFELALQVLLHQRFPFLESLSEEEQFIYSKGEFLFLEQKLKAKDERLSLVCLPKTVYELFFLRGYVEDRLKTPFDTVDTEQNFEEHLFYVLARPFYCDHTSFVQSKITREMFWKQIKDYLDNPYFQFQMYHLNNQILSSLFGILVDGQLTEDGIEEISLMLVNDLKNYEISRNTPESLRIKMWPLSSPFLVDLSENVTVKV